MELYVNTAKPCMFGDCGDTDTVEYRTWLDTKLLNTASARGDCGYLKTLMDAGADVNAVDKCTGNTALMYAAQNGDYKSIKILLNSGADVEIRKNLSTTALMCATSNKVGCTECVKLLLDAGADVYARNHQGRCPLLLASHAGHYNIVRLLLEIGNNVCASDNEGRCALSLACVSGYDQVVNLLIEMGADVNRLSDKGMTPLMHAANKGSVKCAALLLEAGANMSFRDNYGNNAIMWATTTCNNRNQSCVTLLKQAGAELAIAELNAFNSSDDTPLMYAAYNADLKSTRALIEEGADLECKKQNGSTALICASHNKLGCPDVVRLLLESGADVNACTNTGYNALLVASENGLNKIVQVLLDKGCSVNSSDYHGKTALSVACMAGYDESVKLLIKSGADVNLASADGTTPLMRAANRGQSKCAISLLRAGADIDVSDKYGNTALVWALTSNYNNNSCLCLLAQAGANQPPKMSAQCSSMTDSVRRYLLQDSHPLDLQHQCRKVIRRHLMWVHENSNLVATVSLLPLPTAIKAYLLYYVQTNAKKHPGWMNSLSFFTDNIYDTLPKTRAITADAQVKLPNDREYRTQIVGVKTKGYRRMALLCNNFDVIYWRNNKEKTHILQYD